MDNLERVGILELYSASFTSYMSLVKSSNFWGLIFFICKMEIIRFTSHNYGTWT